MSASYPYQLIPHNFSSEIWNKAHIVKRASSKLSWRVIVGTPPWHPGSALVRARVVGAFLECCTCWKMISKYGDFSSQL